MKDFLQKTIRDAGDIAKEYFFRGVISEQKSSPRDLITEADRSVSAYIVDEIHKKYSTHHIKSEELSEDINSGALFEWIIDPIDGTYNFAKGIPLWGVIIALLRNGEPLYGAVYFPISNQLYFAEKGKGACVNDERIFVSNISELPYAKGNIYRSPSQDGPYGSHIERYKRAGALLINDTDVIFLNFGAASAISFVASGAVAFAIGNGGLDWDYIAPFLICEEAGAVVSDSDGNPWKRGRQDYIIANADLHPKLLTFFLHN